MGEVEVGDRDVQVHIHEHMAPLRERLGKIEGRVESHERELTLLRASLDGLRDRVDGTRDALLSSIDAHQGAVVKRVERLDAAQQVCAERLAGLKWWIVGIGGGLGGSAILLQAIRVLHGGGFG